MGFAGPGFSNTEFAYGTDFTAVASSNVEATLLAGANLQPTIPANLLGTPSNVTRRFRLCAKGVFSTTGTPTMTFTVRMSSTQGSATLTGAILGISAAITTGSGVSNKQWWLNVDFVCKTAGQGSGNATVTTSGEVFSPGGFASPFFYPLQASAPDTATWTQTYDGAVNQYLNVDLTWSASSPSNTCTLKQLFFDSLN